jgi:hypothetical protein
VKADEDDMNVFSVFFEDVARQGGLWGHTWCGYVVYAEGGLFEKFMSRKDCHKYSY